MNGNGRAGRTSFADGVARVHTVTEAHAFAGSGGHLNEFLEPQELATLLAEADLTYVAHGAPDRLFGDISPRLKNLSDRACQAGLEFVPSRLRHIGTENCREVLAGCASPWSAGWRCAPTVRWNVSWQRTGASGGQACLRRYSPE